MYPVTVGASLQHLNHLYTPVNPKIWLFQKVPYSTVSMVNHYSESLFIIVLINQEKDTHCLIHNDLTDRIPSSANRQVEPKGFNITLVFSLLVNHANRQK